MRNIAGLLQMIGENPEACIRVIEAGAEIVDGADKMIEAVKELEKIWEDKNEQ